MTTNTTSKQALAIARAKELQGRTADGQYTFKTNSGAEVVLELHPDNGWVFVDTPSDYTELINSGDRRVAHAALAAMYVDVRRSVARRVSKVGLNPQLTEDIVGDAGEHFTVRFNNGKPIQGGLINQYASSLTSRQVNPGVRHEIAKGFKLVAKAIEEAQHESGKELSSKEIDELSEKIRMSSEFKDGHRPPKGFMNLKTLSSPVSASQFSDSYIDEVAYHTGYGQDSSFDGAGSQRDKLVEFVEEKEMSRADAKKQVWSAYSADFDLPPAAENWIARKDAEAVASFMRRDERSIARACQDFEDGKQSKYTVALFAPYGDITPRQKQELVELFISNPHGMKLWRAALEEAVKKPVRRQAAA
ncbi:hypothetical protein [Agromyces humi]|uniref:hypothetical protein n=1 Tax=Agromyces humi TaxID=1766800 RepID=UPI001359C7C2|nr:hypothetical protein [Agromyces humi]